MKHYGEDDLILYFYGEARHRAAIERHLASCAACAAAYRDLAGTLALVSIPDAPERGDQYGLEVWQRIRHTLPEREPRWWLAWFGADRLAIVAAAACLIVAAFAAGRMWPQTATPAGPVVSSTAPTTSPAGRTVRERILIASVADHLDRSERVLTDIMNAPAQGNISAEQRWATELLDASRLYRQDAMDLGEQSVAAVLDDLERSLVEIVHSPATISAADLEQMRRRIDAATLLFKVRVLGDELRRRDGAPADAPRSQTSTRKTS